jgi:hypothetical protein
MHLAVSTEQLSPLKKIPKIREIPLVLEHGENIGLKELCKEKETVEKFLKGI